MKCAFCGINREDVIERENSMELCEDCAAIMHNKRAEVEAVAAEEPVVAEAPKEKEEAPRCEIVIGVKEDGSLYFNAGGSRPDLLVIEGLLGYAKRRLETLWEEQSRR